jgi:hypothetical protein
VVDALRAFLNRPLNDADRPRLFAVAVALILSAAALLALLDDAGPAPAEPEAPARTPPPPAAVAPEAAPSEEGEPTAAAEASRADVTQAKRAAREFLAGYLPYAYGRDVAGIARATPELRRELARERPRVPVRERRRRPRVVLLQSDGVSRRHAELRALVDDGPRRYAVPLELERTANGWTVTALGT